MATQGNRKVAARAGKTTAAPFQYVTAGPHTPLDGDGKPNPTDRLVQDRLRSIRAAASNGILKTAGLGGEGSLGAANIADSDNIGYNSFEFPLDSLEMPASRPEELRFYRLAYDRDPIVARAIDLHTELPCSKMSIEKPKCSVEEFSDYVYDWFQRLVNDTRLFATVIEATREYNIIGEAYLFVEMPPGFDDYKLCAAATEALKNGRGFQAGVSPMSEAENAPIVGQEKEILNDFVEAKKKKTSSYNLLYKTAADKPTREERKALIDELIEGGIAVDPDEDVFDTIRVLTKKKAKLAKLNKLRLASIKKKADPGDPPAPDAGAPVEGGPGGDPIDAPMDGADGDIPPADDFGGGGAPPASFGGGGGRFGGGPSISPDAAQGAQEAISLADDAKRTMEISELKRTISLLEKKKGLLEELQDLVEKKQQEKEIFSHIVNDQFEGFDRIQMLAPEQVEIKNDKGSFQFLYKPSATEKTTYLDDPEVPKNVKDFLTQEGSMPLNTNPFEGSYAVHFARKKAGYELHGRSILQRCMRHIIYREKLRQVQTTLASRNMTPKTIISAPGVSAIEVAELRALADEAKADPDFTIVVNYALDWNEISSQGRLLQLSDEYSQLNTVIAVGMGLSPDILMGEGVYGGNRIQLEILNTTYTQYRETLTDLLENQIFKVMAMIKGFYEKDRYGRPRWIFPKVTFGRMALRDSSDVMEQMMVLYQKGSLPVNVIYDFMNLDPETIRRDLENDLWTVNDSRFNEGLGSVYSAVSERIINQTDVISRLAKNMQLTEAQEDQSDMEGSGEGM
jgi:hypothetical protein